MKKLIVFAGNHKQYNDLIKESRYLTLDNTVYVCQPERIRSVHDGAYILTGEFWLNPVYRSSEVTLLEQQGRIKLLENPQDICDYLGLEYTPPDLGVSINESVNSKDKVL